MKHFVPKSAQRESHLPKKRPLRDIGPPLNTPENDAPVTQEEKVSQPKLDSKISMSRAYFSASAAAKKAPVLPPAIPNKRRQKQELKG